MFSGFCRFQSSSGNAAGMAAERGATLSQGRLRPIQRADETADDSEPVDRLRLISAWSLAILAVIAVVGALYFAREPLIPVTTALVVGIMLSPAARALEERRVPRLLTAALMVLATALVIGIVAALIATPMADLAGRIPQIGAKLQVFHGLLEFLAALRTLDRDQSCDRSAHPSAAEPRMGVDDDRFPDAAAHRIHLFPGGASPVHFLVARSEARPRHDLREPGFPPHSAQDPQRNGGEFSLPICSPWPASISVLARPPA